MLQRTLNSGVSEAFYLIVNNLIFCFIVHFFFKSYMDFAGYHFHDIQFLLYCSYQTLNFAKEARDACNFFPFDKCFVKG